MNAPTQVKTTSWAVWLAMAISALPAAGQVSDMSDESSLQETFPQARPQDYGLDIPDGDPIPSGGRRVALVDLYERFVVGRVHVEVDDKFIVLLPDGRLYPAKKHETIPTDRPFRPYSKDEILDHLTAKDFKGFKSKSTARFLYVYNTSENFAKATSTILETMYPSLYSYCEQQGLAVHDPEFPLTVLMFRNRQEFDRYRAVPAGVVAYYNIVTNQVVMYSDSDMAQVLPELAMKTSIATIAHEGVHQILYNIGVQQRLSRWPMWITEGLPEFFAPTEAGKRVRWKGLGLVHDMRMHHLVEHSKKYKNKGSGWFGLQRNIEAANLDALGYAKSWATVYVLAKHKKDAFAAFLREATQLGPLEQPPSPGVLFRKHFGEKTDEVQDYVVKQLKRVDYINPYDNLTYYVVMAKSRFRRPAMMSPSPRAILEWCGKYGGVGRIMIQPFPNKRAAEAVFRRL